MKGAFWMHAMQRYLRVSQRLYLEGAWVLNGRRWMGSAMPRLASSSSSSPKAKTKAESVVTVLQLPRLAGTSKRIMEEHPDKDESNSAQLQTPLAREISALRAQYPDHLVLVQVGSFYEIYEPDAKLEEICNLLNIRIAQKRVRASSETLRFAGFPVSRAKEYLDLLLRNGYTIALADQTGKDSQSKTKNFIRSVTRILSPGTILQDSSELEMSDNHFLLCVTVPPNASALTKSTKIGLCWVDITTGEFFLSETSASQLSSQVSRIQPVEVLLSKDYRTLVESSDSLLGQVFGQDRQDKSFFITYRDSDIFDAPNDPLSHWITQNDPCKALKPTRVLEDFTRMEVRAGSALLAYIGQNFPQTKPSFRQPIDVSHETHMLVDYTTLQALEITKTSRERTKVGSLLHRIDKTLTAAGGRLIAARLKSPSLSIPEINRRLDLIQLFYDDTRLTHDVRHLLLSAKDVERSLQRLHMETGGPSDFMNIILTLETVLALSARLKEKIASSSTQSMDPSVRTSVERMISQLGSFKDLVAKYSEFLEEEAFRIGRIENPGCIRTGFHQGLDTLRESKASMLVQKERLTKGLSAMLGMTEFSLGLDQKHGPVLMFPRLRIPVKKVVEASLDKSEDFEKISRRSPSNLTYSYNQWTKLFTHLEDIENRMVKLENAIFTEACQDLRDGSLEITEMMQQLAELDASCALAYVARESGYVRPTFTDSAVLDIQGGRHPVVEFSQLHRHHSYVKNDCHVGGDESIWLLTGANMGGKSTFLRQCAIITIMAQAGSFVPADSAKIGIVDRIFSRIGASDNLAANQSTFMVEMAETSVILNESTSKSLVIMDEIGRGTSTMDGFSLAYAILVHLQNSNQCRALFATHYHELAKLIADASHQESQSLPFKNVACYKTDVYKDTNGDIFCLYQIVKGIMNESHGIQMAKKAGLPSSVIETASQLYKSLECSIKPIPLKK